MGKRTPLYNSHVELHAKIVDFAGWDMPLHYGSQLQEHHDVRTHAGLFDVSHMTILDIEGPDTADFLRYLLANNIDKLVFGKALYTCMLNEQGGVIDDLIVYKISDNSYRLVVNSGTREKDIAWIMTQQKNFTCDIHLRDDLAMIAIQGPMVRGLLPQLFSHVETAALLALPVFHALQCGDYFMARTGYTGEEGFEVIVPADKAVECWQRWLAVGAKPCGLGARDTLRLEAGLNLYGADMDETVTPLESNLSWTVAFSPKERNFIGRAALEKQQLAGLTQKLVGIILQGNGVLRNHQKVQVEGIGEGEITSGSFSPTLQKGIALARVPFATESHCTIEMRGKWVPAFVIPPPFVRHGKKTVHTMMESQNE